MIRVHQAIYDGAQEALARGNWRIDPARGVLQPGSDRLAGSINTSGYRKLSHSVNGRQICVLAHRVIWEAINGPIPEGMFINHRDGDKLNNAIDNLEMVTHLENMRHAHETGLMEPNYLAVRKRGDDIARKVFVEMWESGDPAHVVADRNGVNVGWARNVKYRRSYRSITQDIQVAKRDPRNTAPLFDIVAAQADRNAGMSTRALARKYGTSQRSIQRMTSPAGPVAAM